jgi:hypothetical protein
MLASASLDVALVSLSRLRERWGEGTLSRNFLLEIQARASIPLALTLPSPASGREKAS